MKIASKLCFVQYFLHCLQFSSNFDVSWVPFSSAPSPFLWHLQPIPSLSCMQQKQHNQFIRFYVTPKCLVYYFYYYKRVRNSETKRMSKRMVWKMRSECNLYIVAFATVKIIVAIKNWPDWIWHIDRYYLLNACRSNEFNWKMITIRTIETNSNYERAKARARARESECNGPLNRGFNQYSLMVCVGVCELEN